MVRGYMKYCSFAVKMFLSKGHSILYLVRNVWYVVVIFSILGKASLNCTSEPYGRAKIRDYVIRESDKGDSKWLNVVSKCQCKIVLNSTGVFLREKSSNSIWVNSNKVGKDNIWPLKHNSEICFLGWNKKATSGSFPPEMTTKNTVLGKEA